MPSYDIFSQFYDAIMGDRAASTERLRHFIRSVHPHAKTVLELGCGTGSVLKNLAADYLVWGVDQSRNMLALARKKVPQAALFRQDMAKFRIGRKFDVICCVYDSINHLLSFSAWKKLFANVSRHLETGGVFIFDINTQRKLDRHIAEPPWVHRFGGNFLIMTITRFGRKASNWNIKVFEHATGNRYLLHEENIREASFPERDIVTALRRHFRHIEIIDTDRRRPSSKSERLYFICKT